METPSSVMRQERFCSCAYYTMYTSPKVPTNHNVEITFNQYHTWGIRVSKPQQIDSQSANKSLHEWQAHIFHHRQFGNVIFLYCYFMSAQKYLKTYRSFAILKVIHTHIDYIFTSFPGILTNYIGFDCLQDKKQELATKKQGL